MQKINIETFRQYQENAKKTDLIDDVEGLDPKWVYYVLGLNGEVGELTEKAKKVFRDNKGMLTATFRTSLVSEAGDILWYLTRLMNYLGIDMVEVASYNVAKLQMRMENDTLHGDGDDR